MWFSPSQVSWNLNCFFKIIIIFGQKCHLLAICQMTNTKGKGRSTHYTSSGPFRKHGVASLATYMWIYQIQERWYCWCQGNGYYSERNAPQVSPWQSLQCEPSCCWHCCKQIRTRFLPRELMYVLNILSTLNGEGNGNPLQYPCLEHPVDGGAW